MFSALPKEEDNMRKQLISVAIAGLALVGAAGAAKASDVHVSLGLGVYSPPPPVVYAPPPVVYAPPPQVYAAPVVVAPAPGPVVVYPAYRGYYRHPWHRWHEDRD
jgi:hypothetical protein